MGEDMGEATKLTHFSLFSGIGGIDIAAEWAGFETVGQCEWADYPTKVLEKHWPDVPRWRDIKTLTGESFYERTGRKTVDVVSGGFPCQPFSAIGQRKGEEDDRFLWPEMARIIRELRPRWVIGENVVGILNMGVEQTLAELGGLGYKGGIFVIPACAMQAFHQRKRVFIIANNDSILRPSVKPQTIKCHKNVLEKQKEWEQFFIESSGNNEFEFREEDESRICRMDDGFPEDVDRLKCLGNAVVPQQIYPILKAIAEIEFDTGEPEETA